MKRIGPAISIWVLVLLIPVFGIAVNGMAQISVSGELVGGFRVVPLPPSGDAVHLTVYRGDYVKFIGETTRQGAVMSIPRLGVSAPVAGSPEAAPYFKMKETGRFEFTAGPVRGVLEVVDYRSPRYAELTSREAADLIRSRQPLVLDVRTRREYARGHLPGSTLIPVQELQRRLPELSAYRQREILIYCATGNRSTVAAKILLDAGFAKVYNMRRGIADWLNSRLPVAR
jgi:rhodanese-related sulfurtransferase